MKNQDFIVTARKWRPLSFEDVVGQNHITKTLQNAIEADRVHHAYLFCGPRGVGKTTTARILARALNCTESKNSEPCNECESCQAILGGRSMDVIEIDGASNNSVDDIRKLRENAKYPPVSGNYKMYIIDEVHMLSTSAFNALLKTLEEPPPHLMFVFATTESHKLPATIISRCQRFDFRRMEIDSIAKQLKYISESESIKFDEESLITIAIKADGSMRDAQSIFDQVIAFCGTDVKYIDMAEALHLIDQDFFFKISTAVLEKNVKEMFSLTQEVISRGYDLQECLQGLLEHFRNILTINITNDSSLIESSASFIEKYENDAVKFSKADLLRYMNLISTVEQSLRFAAQPRVKFELALVQIASMDKSVEISELLEEIKKLNNTGADKIVAQEVNKAHSDIVLESKLDYESKKNDSIVLSVAKSKPNIGREIPKAESNIPGQTVDISKPNEYKTDADIAVNEKVIGTNKDIVSKTSVADIGTDDDKTSSTDPIEKDILDLFNARKI